MWSELTHVQDPSLCLLANKLPQVVLGEQVTPSGPWRTSYPKWSLAPEQIVQLLRIFAVLDAGVLGPLGSLRSASCQQPRGFRVSVFTQRPSSFFFSSSGPDGLE